MTRFFASHRLSNIQTQYVDPTVGPTGSDSDDVRGRQFGTFSGFYSRQALPTDPVGTVDISFTGVKLGSEIKIFDDDSTLLDGTESSGATPSFTLQRYAPGSPYNTLRILIIALQYEVIDITYELTATDTTIPVFQRIDRNYRNPV